MRQARERNIPVKTFTIPMHDVDRAIADDEEVGFVKINVKERTDRILGATIVARHAGEMISEITLAIVAGIGLRTLARVIHAYPTQAEAIKKAADAYTRTRSMSRAQRLATGVAALAAPIIPSRAIRVAACGGRPMAHEAITLIAQYGLLLVFVNVLVEQAGAPVPAMPTLVVAGAVAASGDLSITAILLVSLVACLLGDLPWYWAGRHFGGAMMRTLCRISLSPDSCVRNSEMQFERWGGRMLVVAKFVPGLSIVAPPLVGAMGLPLHLFLLLDGACVAPLGGCAGRIGLYLRGADRFAARGIGECGHAGA